VSLEGTLETIALPDVLALLSVTAKTGELRIEAGGGVGSVWFDAGKVTGFDVGNHKTVVDALFALLRLQEGTFKFLTGAPPADTMSPQDVAPVLEEAENRLMQWPAIVASVPSLYCDLALRESVEGSVILRPDQWQLVATIAGGGRVVDVLSLRGLGEFDGCKAVKELVDQNLVRVGTHNGPSAPELPLNPPAYTDEPAELGDEHGEWDEEAPGLEEKHEADVADLSSVWEDETGGHGELDEEPEEDRPAASVAEPVNRGLLLKFLGSARN
jgi:hypothetical protein